MEYTPAFTPAQAVTFTASSAVIGSRLVEITGDRSVGPAAANSTKVIGVAAFDAKAMESVTVHLSGVQRLQASAAIAAGDLVAAAADGKIATTDGATPAAVIGIALQAAAAVDEVIEVQSK